MPHGLAISAFSLAVWWAKLEKYDKVKHNIMIQVASLLVVFICLMSSQRGGLIRETKLLMQELELKMEGGGLMREGGFYGI